MAVVQEGEHQRHGDGGRARGADRLDQRRHLVLRQRRHLLALGVDAAGDLEAPAARDEHGRPVLEQVVEVAAGAAAELQHVAEAARRDEGGVGALSLPARRWSRPWSRATAGSRPRRRCRAGTGPRAGPPSRPAPKSGGVVRTLATAMRPLSSSTSATSVKVPPMSTPMRQGMVQFSGRRWRRRRSRFGRVPATSRPRCLERCGAPRGRSRPPLARRAADRARNGAAPEEGCRVGTEHQRRRAALGRDRAAGAARRQLRQHGRRHGHPQRAGRPRAGTSAGTSTSITCSGPAPCSSATRIRR